MKRKHLTITTSKYVRVASGMVRLKFPVILFLLRLTVNRHKYYKRKCWIFILNFVLLRTGLAVAENSSQILVCSNLEISVPAIKVSPRISYIHWHSPAPVSRVNRNINKYLYKY